MTIDSQSLEFSPTPLSLTIAIGFVVVIVALSMTAWWRSGWRAATGWLEALRIVIAIAIALTLLQPEWRQTFEPTQRPTVTVLVDQSGSMETRDVFDSASGGPGAGTRSRLEAAAALLEDETWSALQERFEVVLQPFSSEDEVPPEEATDYHAALTGAGEQHENLAAVVLAGDGDWNIGAPPSQAATRLRMRGVPVIAVPVGSTEPLPDVAIHSFEVPVFAIADKPLRIPFTLTSTLPRDENVTVEMQAPGGEVVTREVVLPAMGRVQDSLVWQPRQVGDATLTLTVPPTGDETHLDNNTLEASLEVRREELRVLVIDSYPRWEYRYLRNALERDPGVEVKCLLFHPDLDRVGGGRDYLEQFPGDDELAGYDVVFLGDVGVAAGQLNTAQIESLRDLVRDQASGLVLMPGLQGFQAGLLDTALDELMPVVWDRSQPRGWGTATPGRFVLTEAGRASLLTKLEDSDEASAATWSSLPGFHWYAPALRARAGSEVLAMHANESTRFGRVPLIVTRTFGAGKVLFMGTDGAWRWRRGVEDRYHYRFWGQVVRWMAYQRNMAQGERMRLFYGPDRPRTREVLTLNANVMSLSGEPMREGTVVAEIEAPSGRVSSVRLASAGEEAWGLFTGLFTPTEPGPHRVRLSSAEAGDPLETVIPIQGTTREQRGQPARPEVLEEIAQLTRGRVVDPADLTDVVAAVAALPELDPEQRRLPLWSHPLWAGTIILLLGIFWIGRKTAGLF